MQEVLGKELDFKASPFYKIMEVAYSEWQRAKEKYGEENHPIKPDDRDFKAMAEKAKEICDKFEGTSEQTWFYIFQEAFFEVFAEDNPAKQNEELIQAIAVAARMIESNAKRQS
jgi:hypothetical protein